jgi:hypothetical protein
MCGRQNAGSYAPLACIVFVDREPHRAPPSTSLQVFADLRIFGRGERWPLGRCIACGSPPETFELDLQIPPDMAPGVKTFTVWATDAEGRFKTVSASLEVRAGNSAAAALNEP